MSERVSAAYEAATMHYVQGETMETIARRLNVSRSTVSRLIKVAREEGLVQITLHAPQETSSKNATWISQHYGVRTHVVPIPFQANEARRLTAVAQMTGVLISNLMEPHTVIGVAWGNTVSAIADHLVPRPAHGSVVVQLNGAANPSTTGIPYAGAIMEAFGRAHGSMVQHFSVPAFFDYAATKEALWRERSIESVRKLQASADIAVFGVGSMTGRNVSLVYSGGYLSSDDLASIKDDGVVGDVCTVLMRADGSWKDLAINKRASGPTPDELKKIKRRLCVVSGVDKVVAARAALHAGVVTDLIIDEDAAARLRDLG
ncbi:helix-turn-helix domain-containing protein [Arcanobacterium phocisimile]|uniref:Helix-turn-helix domain-containing protein n=1 Tax=Arcanobacterium phocisimile TaxID=1302235 RepID=A0ABX7IHJ4_9ACTO|nr:sugar-binding domain-containing protein [Arcanobacterium phocisimile]QRV02432.1 helix-turn-helix domain-containing protein [Arcanobacterium phocisimile]